MPNDPRAITFMGKTDFRNQEVKFGIRSKDRLRHMYVIGKSGVGKSTLLENMCAQDIMNGNGCAFFDPHGGSAELMLRYVPPHRIDDVIYFAPHDSNFPISFNPLEHDDFVDQSQRNFAADSLLAAFKKIWGAEKFSDRMEYILSMTLLALLEYPEATLLGINRMYSDKEFRARVVEHVTDITVKSFWTQTFATWDPKYAREATAAIENKVGQLSSNPMIRNIVGQPKSSFDFREIMDNKKIFIANLSIGRIGEQNTSLLGAMLMSKLYLSAMSRADQNKSQMDLLPPFFLFVDEFQNFANDAFENILSQARKYKLGLTVAHQYVEQMPEKLKAGIFGNMGTMVTFRVGPDDAEVFEKQFAPVFKSQDFVNLAPFQIYMSLLIDDLGSRPFSARTLPPLDQPSVDSKEAVIENSRRCYGTPREEVEAKIAAWYAPIPTKKDLEHQEFLAKKKQEAEAQGKQWVPHPKEQVFTQPQNTNPRPPAPQVPQTSEYGKTEIIETRANGTTEREIPKPVQQQVMNSVTTEKLEGAEKTQATVSLSDAFSDILKEEKIVVQTKPAQGQTLIEQKPKMQTVSQDQQQQKKSPSSAQIPPSKSSSPMAKFKDKEASVDSVSRLKEILEKAKQNTADIPTAPKTTSLQKPNLNQNINTTEDKDSQYSQPKKSSTLPSSEISAEELASIFEEGDI